MKTSALWNVLLFYGILVGVNIPAPWIGLEFEKGQKVNLWYAPPGWVIPVAWFILFALLGLARTKLQDIDANGLDHWLFLLAMLCASYAYYTLGLGRITGLSPLWFGLWGNLIIILVTTWICRLIVNHSLPAALLVAPIAIWTIYATIIVLGEMRQNHLL